MDTFVRDLRYAWRGLRKNPSVSVIAVVALGLGIGVTAVMFSIVYGALHRGLPFEGGDRIIHLERSNPEQGLPALEVPIHDFRDWEERQRSFEHFGAFYRGTVTMGGTERPERYEGAFMTASVFDVVGVQPVLGRAFTPEEERPGAPPVVVIGYGVWQDRYAGSRDVLGQVVTVNGQSGSIIGVMPEGFEFPILQEVWLPLRLDPGALERGTGESLEVVGLLDPAVSLDRAAIEFAGIARQLAAENPETNTGVGTILKPYTEEFIGQQEQTVLYAMLFTVVLVLIIACANVANLLLARASTRTRDVAIRTALGAERRRVVTQLLAESVVLALAGAALGLVVAAVGISAFERTVSQIDPPFWISFELDRQTLLFVLAITGVAAVSAGIIPAIKASGMDVSSVLKDDSRGSSSLQIGRLSRALVIGEVALSMALLVASALMVKGVVRLDNTDFGFDTDAVFSARIAVFDERFPDAESRLRFWEEVERRVGEVAGVAAATVTGSLPGTGSFSRPVQLDGRSYLTDADVPATNFIVASPSFAETFGVDVLQGRWLEVADNADSPPVVVVNERFVEQYVPDGSAVGRRIRFGGLESDDPWREIVGVVPNYRIEGTGSADPGAETDLAGMYLPLAQYDLRAVSVAATTAGVAPLSITAGVRDAVIAADAETPIFSVQTIAEAIDRNTWFYRIFGNLFLAFGGAALFLASVGLYGVMSFGVNQRAGEMGIRMALGAESRQVLAMVMRQGFMQILIGVVAGSGIALLVARGLQQILFQVEPFDLTAFVGVFLLLAATGAAASFLPALRATRVDPMGALRRD